MTPTRDDGWADSLLSLAESWPTYESTTTYGPVRDASGTDLGIIERPCVRCLDCECVIPGQTREYRAQHLVLYHGYRMDGRKENEQ